MGRHKNLEKRQLEMKLRKDVETVHQKATALFEDEANILYQVEILNGEIKSHQSKIAALKIKKQALESKYAKALEKHHATRLRIITKTANELAKKEKNLCSSCGQPHKESPPDACWLKVFPYRNERGEIQEAAKAFDAYLRENNFGKLDFSS